jgi:hypothetical protein
MCRRNGRAGARARQATRIACSRGAIVSRMHTRSLPPILLLAAASANAATLGTWSNVTPAGIDLNPASFNNDNFGVQDVLADPARPGDLYAFTCHQGVWKSIDFGVTWTKINTGTNGATLDTGKLWTAAIDPNAARSGHAADAVDRDRQQRFMENDDGIFANGFEPPGRCRVCT